MSDDMDDDLDDVEDTTSNDQLDDGDDDSEGEVATSKPRKKNAPVEEEGASVEAKDRERDMLARQMEEFLSRGGKVQEIDSNVVSDPPRKPDNKYGSRPI